MRVTVLGKSPAWQDAGGACSGYLVREAGLTLLLDCGTGVFARLREHVSYADVDAIVVSHLHPDHFWDLVPYAYGLLYGSERASDGRRSDARPVVHAPPGARDAFRRLGSAFGGEDLIETAFDLREYDPEEEVAVGALRVRFHPVPHFTATNAVEVRSTAGPGRLTYGADHGPTDDLAAFARDTDLLLIEATLPRPERAGPRGHLTPGEAGEHGRDAGARRVVLTHISDELDAGWAAQEASRAFGATVDVAHDGAVYEI